MLFFRLFAASWTQHSQGTGSLKKESCPVQVPAYAGKDEPKSVAGLVLGTHANQIRLGFHPGEGVFHAGPDTAVPEIALLL